MLSNYGTKKGVEKYQDAKELDLEIKRITSKTLSDNSIITTTIF